MVAPERGNFFLKTFENDRSMKTGNVNAFAKRKEKKKEKERNRFRCFVRRVFLFSSLFLLSFCFSSCLLIVHHSCDRYSIITISITRM